MQAGLPEGVGARPSPEETEAFQTLCTARFASLPLFHPCPLHKCLLASCWSPSSPLLDMLASLARCGQGKPKSAVQSPK